MASDPEIREGLLENLERHGGAVYGSTFGEVVRKVLPQGSSMNQAKTALNSLAYSSQRPRQVTIRRTGSDPGISGTFGGYHVVRL